jgi:predicted translin family RNA/ssDNA-binding protein
MTEEKVKGAERTEALVAALRRWQAIERQAIDQTAEMIEKTDNALVRQILEIIRNDSVQHHRVQQFIIDSLTKTPVSLKPEDLAEIWTQIEQHDQAEREVIELGKKLRDDCKLFVQKALLDYLIYDEEKHDKILGDLEKFKRNLYPYA